MLDWVADRLRLHCVTGRSRFLGGVGGEVSVLAITWCLDATGRGQAESNEVVRGGWWAVVTLGLSDPTVAGAEFRVLVEGGVEFGFEACD